MPKRKTRKRKSVKTKSRKPKKQSFSQRLAKLFLPETKKRSTSKRKKFSFIGWVSKWGFIGLVWGGIVFGFLLLYYGLSLPDVSTLDNVERAPRVTILDKNGETLASYGSNYGQSVTFDDLPPHLIQAVLATEDRRFFTHFGIDPFGLLRAMIVNLQAGRIVQGGSTITQQTAKVLFLSPERTLKRKIQEVLLALYLEHHFTKEEILALYLNRIYLGSGNYGIAAAAENYFKKTVSDLTLEESAIIAGLIKAPSRYSPIKNLALAKLRGQQVLENMVNSDYLETAPNMEESHLANLIYPDKHKTNQTRYFTEWVMEQVPDYIGRPEEDIIITTTFNPQIHEVAYEAAVTRLAARQAKQEQELADAQLDNATTNPEQAGEEANLPVVEDLQVAVIVMTPEGAIQTIIGGKDYSTSQFNRAVNAYRQPGSSFKLFTYLTAFENGYKPNDTLVDEPIQLDEWTPKNWDDTYRGEVSLRNAFSQSINTVAVQLGKIVGIGNIIKMAHKLGITNEISHNLSSVLGTSEINLLEMTTAYAHLANNGQSVWVHGIEKIETYNNEILFERSPSQPEQILTPQTTAYMNDLLLSVVETGTGKRAQLPGRDVAGKTGTSQGFRDAWFIGFTPQYVTGVWIGKDDDTSMKRVGGGGLAAIVWRDFMHAALTEQPKQSIATSAYDVRRDRVDKGSSTSGGSFWQRLFGGTTRRENSKTKRPDIEYSYPD